MSVIPPAHALEKLNYNQSLSTRISNLIHNHTQISPDIARADLNEDGIDEFIVRERGCGTTEGRCRHQVLAQSNDSLIELGRINANYLMLSNNYDHGIRSIMAFKDKNNDFEYDVYVWEPSRSQYILVEN